jgi:hypothetical protein
MSIVLTLDSTLYRPECVRAAVASFSELATIQLQLCPMDISVEFLDENHSSELVDEFLNNALMRSIEQHLSQDANQ